MFAVMACCSLAAGILINTLGWRLLNLLALSPLLLILALVLLLTRLRARARLAR
jgi:hypothetical protein